MENHRLLNKSLTIEQQWWYANLLSNSVFVPKSLKNKPNDIFIIMQYGKELGISPMASLHGIAVINSKPQVYGDLLVSLMVNHKDFKDFYFNFRETNTDGLICDCVIQRKNREPFLASFSELDAKKANLINKDNWKNYLRQMLMRRSLSEAFRYVFPDVLFNGGLILEEPYFDSKNNPVTNIQTTSPAIKKIEDSSQPNTLQYSSITLEYMYSIFRVTPNENNPDDYTSRFEICNFFQSFNSYINDPDVDTKFMLSILAILLKEYVNSNIVNEKIDSMILEKGVSPTELSEKRLADIICDTFSTKTIEKIISRLLTWVPRRISCIDSLKDFVQRTGTPETFVLSKSSFFGSNFINNEYSSNELKISFSKEYRSFVKSMTLNSDLISIPLEYLEDMKEDIPMRISQVKKGYFVSKKQVDEINNSIKSKGLCHLTALHPFVNFPDSRLVLATDINNVLLYCNYLDITNQNPTTFLNPEEVCNLLELCIKNKKSSKELARHICGVEKVNISEIPKQMLSENLNTFFEEKKD